MIVNTESKVVFRLMTVTSQCLLTTYLNLYVCNVLTTGLPIPPSTLPLNVFRYWTIDLIVFLDWRGFYLLHIPILVVFIQCLQHFINQPTGNMRREKAPTIEENQQIYCPISNYMNAFSLISR